MAHYFKQLQKAFLRMPTNSHDLALGFCFFAMLLSLSFSVIWYFESATFLYILNALFFLVYFLYTLFFLYVKIVKHLLFLLVITIYFNVLLCYLLLFEVYPSVCVWLSLPLLTSFLRDQFNFARIILPIMGLILIFRRQISHTMGLNFDIEYSVSVEAYHLILFLVLATIYFVRYTNILEYDKFVIDQKNKNLLFLNKEIEDSEKFKVNFFNQVSHEIRTPLNALSGVSQLLQKTSIDENQIKLFKIIDTATSNLIILLNDFLEVSKIQAGKSFLTKTQFIFKDAINFVQELQTSKAQEKGLDFIVEVDHNIPKYCVGDQIYLNQILISLTNNSIKHSSNGSVKLVVELKEKTKKTLEIKFSVIDSGPGFSKLFIDSLSQEFIKTKTADYNDAFISNNNLNLILCSKLINLLGGRLKVESIPDLASKISFKLKFDIPECDINNLVALADDSSKINLKNVNVLLVDDNTSNKIIARYILENNGLNVFEAENGQVAIDILEKGIAKFDVILMDLNMPVVSGFEALNYIKDKLNINIPIIALSANNLKEEKENYLSYGFASALQKPYKEKELLNVIVESLQTSDV